MGQLGSWMSHLSSQVTSPVGTVGQVGHLLSATVDLDRKNGARTLRPGPLPLGASRSVGRTGEDHLSSMATGSVA